MNIIDLVILSKLENSKSETLVLDDNKIKTTSYNTSLGYGLRAVTGDVTAYSHSNEISKHSLKESSNNLFSTIAWVAIPAWSVPGCHKVS